MTLTKLFVVSQEEIKGIKERAGIDSILLQVYTLLYCSFSSFSSFLFYFSVFYLFLLFFLFKTKFRILGHWGCGAFGGNKHLKFVQQLMGMREEGGGEGRWEGAEGIEEGIEIQKM